MLFDFTVKSVVLKVNFPTLLSDVLNMCLKSVDFFLNLIKQLVNNFLYLEDFGTTDRAI